MEKISEKLISTEKARELQSNWVGNQGMAIEKNGFKDVRDFLFNLEDLQEYIDYVRVRSREQGIDNPGIRVFFGAYAADKENDATVFLSPTMNIQERNADDHVPNNYEISPLNTIQGGYPPITYTGKG